MRKWMSDVGVPVGMALALALVVQGAVAKPYEIPTGSMIPTIEKRDRIIANRIVYRFREPRRGDIVVFNPGPEVRPSCGGNPSDDVPFVKRLIGIPGDRVQVRDNIAYVNGRRYEVPSAQVAPAINANRNFPADPDAQPVTVPAGKLFFLGDNRIDSCDARNWRGTTGEPAPFVDRDQVIGQAEATYWPPKHLGLLDGSPGFVGEPVGASSP